MSSLLRLPTELILDILSFFNPVEDTADLLSLCRVSRKLYAFAQPILYDQFSEGSYCPDCHDPDSSLDSRGPLMYFTRTIIDRPDLGARLRRLLVSTWDWNQDTFKQWPDALEPDMVKTLTKGIQQLNTKNKARWLPAVLGRVTSPLVALLISQAPNIEYLHMILGQDCLKALLLLLERVPGDNPGPTYLSKLKTLSIRDNSGAENGLSLRSLKPILHLPRLEHFSITHCVGNHEDDIPFDMEPASINISFMSFWDSSISAKCLATLMKAFKSLRTFIYHASNHLPYEQFEASEVEDIFSSQRLNIEVIHLELSADPDNMDWDEYPKYESFASFENLTHLDVEQGPWSSTVEIPSSLEYLAIRNCEYPIFDLMANIAKQGGMSDSQLGDVYIKPKGAFCGGLLGLLPSLSLEEVSSNPVLKSVFKRACRRLSRILEESGVFAFMIDCEIWELYVEGEL
ncbi:hypothetical protein ASPWEDRAFT_46756 [Aspergillus wentii DTO 134E9]|uniref:F-box domain-containing protein n=1 Tax=Aspergillus wentii DTO 134E9 TaxID=1073089 RepID=A0A1L9R543_ASPWE|nr:uncharacterized protein ASPWEDRAFT_46756 [Aspergillus wentii DTO 134E9]KAI9927300.1 hypothetical protein MW887_003687 [Aspergillus wentii]OJJ30030.1 hypothetical protein ASPWEDRAFT_46756 [Aspergillus wentii DTO 134E9]